MNSRVPHGRTIEQEIERIRRGATYCYDCDTLHRWGMFRLKLAWWLATGEWVRTGA